MSFVQDVLLPYPLETIERALDLATAQYAREGLTSVTGQLADVVVLEEHPADVAVPEIGAIPVLAAVAGGIFIHRQSES